MSDELHLWPDAEVGWWTASALLIDSIEPDADLDVPVDPAGDRALEESIKTWGILEPVLLLNPGPESSTGVTNSYVVIDGRRRIRAARALGLDTVPARVCEGGDLTDAQELMMGLVVNVRRKSNPVSELRAIDTLLNKGAEVTQIARALSVPVATIKRRMRLLDLAPALREGFESGTIAVGVAEAAAKHSPQVQERMERTYTETGHLSAHDVREAKTVGSQPALDGLGVVLDARPQRDPYLQASQLVDHLLNVLPEEDAYDEHKATVRTLASDLRAALDDLLSQ